MGPSEGLRRILDKNLTRTTVGKISLEFLLGKKSKEGDLVERPLSPLFDDELAPWLGLLPVVLEEVPAPPADPLVGRCETGVV